jgi:hypothetical protein
MTKTLAHLLAMVCCAACMFQGAAAVYTPKTTEPAQPVLIGSSGQSQLFSIEAQGYDDPILLINLKGATRYDLGYDYGFLLANQSATNYQALINIISSDKTVQAVFEWFLDVQYNLLQEQLPQDMKEELTGLSDGGNAAGVPGLLQMTTRGLTLASIATGDVLSDIKWLIIDELFPPKKQQLHGEKLRLHTLLRMRGMTAEDVVARIGAESGDLVSDGFVVRQLACCLTSCFCFD